jgi:hypothetical protein
VMVNFGLADEVSTSWTRGLVLPQSGPVLLRIYGKETTRVLFPCRFSESIHILMFPDLTCH